ncbi:alkaline phosphatase D family protein [Salinicola sp. LHM]|uniref:alkaline phosphatase D family protein n=1 Tax=Salinicola sp. LHM TaxID=3065298 RepID=UPI002ACE9404|nr:alkaline phosphatase D family protein [Salinicola sp. LHM]WQH35062.1 alkaline phosphatase D family protein [Salinicola sp. LHM]
MLRRAMPQRLVMWLVASRPLELQLTLCTDDLSQHHDLESATTRLAVGRHAHLHLIDLPLDDALPRDVRIAYDLAYRANAEGSVNAEGGVNEEGKGTGWRSMRDWGEALCYDGEPLPTLVLRSRYDNLLHGSCRKPHHASADGLVRADRWLSERHADSAARPAALLMTGDQIYADDVAGPMLAAIHALIARLGLYDECLEGTEIASGSELYARDETYYHRDDLLPAIRSTEALREKFFGGVRKPIFTTASAENHLITFAELLAMYLLVWSPTPWRLIEVEVPRLAAEEQDRYRAEQRHIDAFVAGLPGVARLFAHLPTLMIFDDHDVTDDWNLSAAWEAAVYEHPFSRRIVGNALIAYLLCQGWGNDPDGLAEPLAASREWLDSAGHDGRLDCETHNRLVTRLLRFTGWGYTLDSTPRLVVLDTRTRRWRSERRRHHPSGLMDWEALSEFQQELLEEPSVIIVSPAPIFGVKLIEGIQRVFTWFGKPLLVDAENWMAHPGAAHTMLNILRHSRTPQRYVILSGDVHYSFVYAITIRQHRNSPRMWQITSSGLKNTFPDTLLDWFDRLNRWLYAPWSPLNWLTKRRRMAVDPYYPERASKGERLWNRAGIGQVLLDDQGAPREVMQLGADDCDTRFHEEHR